MFVDVDRTCGCKADLLGCRKSGGTPDARMSRMSTLSALNGKDTKHLKNANLGNSTSFVPDPSISRGWQSPQTSGAVPNNSRGALQNGTSKFLCRRPLHGDASARVVEVTHTDCTCGARRQNYDLTDDMQLRPHSGDAGENGNTQHARQAASHPHNFAPSQITHTLSLLFEAKPRGL